MYARLQLGTHTLLELSQVHCGALLHACSAGSGALSQPMRAHDGSHAQSVADHAQFGSVTHCASVGYDAMHDSAQMAVVGVAAPRKPGCSTTQRASPLAPHSDTSVYLHCMWQRRLIHSHLGLALHTAAVSTRWHAG